MASETAGQSELSQDSRWASLKTDLGKDQLVLSRFEGEEALSENFEFRVDAISTQANIDFDALLGTGALVSVVSGHEGVTRHFHGVVVKARWTGSSFDLHRYRLQLRPWFYLLEQTSNCRIFSNKTVIDIINDVFSKYDFAKHEVKVTQSYPVLEYCVQYRESDFAFVSRLMEEFGIYYFFNHSESEHTMVLADAASCHKPKVGGAKLSYYATYATPDQGTGKEDLLHEWIPMRSLRTGKFSMNSFDYKKPTADLLGDKEADSRYRNGHLEHYDYHWRHLEKSNAKDLSNIRLEAEQAKDKIFKAAGNAVSCCPGTMIHLDKHEETSFNQEYLTLRSSHSYQSEFYIAESGEKRPRYEGSYEFLASTIPYRAPQTTPKPIVYGPQTAVVDSEVDEQCRIKVLFYWERDKNQSRYVRIGHGWSGQNWGNIKIPRKGMEVIVEFLDGDPDHPLITGTVYNASNPPPYDLPANKTISGTKSKSYEGVGYNEFIFDDKDGKELVRLHAQKDLEATIENNEQRTVKGNVTIKVDGSRTETIVQPWTAESYSEIAFTVGENSITITPVGIFLKGMIISAQADMAVTVSSSGITSVDAAMLTTVQSEGITMVNSSAMTLVQSAALAWLRGMPPLVSM